MFVIDPMARTPIYEQLIRQTEQLLLCGALRPGDALPSVRALSMQLSINPNTVQRAYADLCQSGLVISIPKKGCFIANQARERLTARTQDRLFAFAENVRELRLTDVTADTLHTIIDRVYTEGGEQDAVHQEFA